MEYVARVVNTEYHKTCFLLNAYNRLVSKRLDYATVPTPINQLSSHYERSNVSSITPFGA